MRHRPLYPELLRRLWSGTRLRCVRPRGLRVPAVTGMIAVLLIRSLIYLKQDWSIGNIDSKKDRSQFNALIKSQSQIIRDITEALGYNLTEMPTIIREDG